VDTAGALTFDGTDFVAPRLRTIAPASGGAEVNNTLTGAGFERVLTVADIAAASFPLQALDTEQLIFGTGSDVIFSFDAVDMNIDFPTAVDLNLNDGIVVKIWDSGNTQAVTTDVGVVANRVTTAFVGLGVSGRWDIENQQANLPFGTLFKGDITVSSENLGFQIADAAGANPFRFDNTGGGLDIIGGVGGVTFATGVNVTINDTLTVNDQISMTSVALFNNRNATTAQLNDIAAQVNTQVDKRQGSQAYNSTTNNPVYAVGSADGDIWVDGAGTTVHTPS
jgi:hypothetical protein